MAIQQCNKMLGFLPLLCGQSFKKSRCKKLLKISISRIQLLKNRRAVQVKQLRRDVAQLLQFGQEQGARTRLARLWKEQNLLSAYDIIEQYCKLLIPNLANIGGQRSCPVDLMEPLSSLIFAASSCADLPELQDVREILALKYGNEFVTAVQELHRDCRVNEEILESFSARGPSEAAKLALLEGIAKEYDLTPRFWPRISALPEDLHTSVETTVECQTGQPHHCVFEKARWTPTSIRSQEILNSYGRDMARDNDDGLYRTRRIKMSSYKREEIAQHADGNLECSHSLASFNQRNAKVIESVGLDECRGSQNGELVNSVERETFQPAQRAGNHDSQFGSLRSVDPLLYARHAGSFYRENADLSLAGDAIEALKSSEMISSDDIKRAGEHDFDFDERKNFTEFYDRRHRREAKSRRTGGKISANKIIDPDEVTLVLCSTANDYGDQSEHDGSISLFIPKTLSSNFPEPPRRPPPPPPVRVASSPSISIQSPTDVSYQRSSTLGTYRFEEHRKAHVHPRLPQYDDLVTRFAALKCKSQNQ